MKRSAILAILAAAVLGACGSDGPTTVTETRTVIEQADGTRTTGATSARGSQDCDELGVNNKVRNTGTCKSGGTKFTVVNRDETLKFPNEYWARLDGVETADSVSGFETYTATDKLVIATITVTNKSNAPRAFEGNEDSTGLTIDGKIFSPSFDAMNGPAERSCMWLDPSEIQPESSKTCQVIFDISEKFVAQLEKREAAPGLVLVPFSEMDSYGEADWVGVIRLYN